MNCQELLDRMLDPTVLPTLEQDQEAVAHLAACPDCRSHLALERKLAEGFAAIAERHPPAQLAGRILEIPQREAETAPSFLTRFMSSFQGFWMKTALSTAVAGVVMIVVWIGLLPQHRDAAPLPEDRLQLAKAADAVAQPPATMTGGQEASVPPAGGEVPSAQATPEPVAEPVVAPPVPPMLMAKAPEAAAGVVPGRPGNIVAEQAVDGLKALPPASDKGKLQGSPAVAPSLPPVSRTEGKDLSVPTPLPIVVGEPLIQPDAPIVMARAEVRSRPADPSTDDLAPTADAEGVTPGSDDMPMGEVAMMEAPPEPEENETKGPADAFQADTGPARAGHPPAISANVVGETKKKAELAGADRGQPFGRTAFAPPPPAAKPIVSVSAAPRKVHAAPTAPPPPPPPPAAAPQEHLRMAMTPSLRETQDRVSAMKEDFAPPPSATYQSGPSAQESPGKFIELVLSRHAREVREGPLDINDWVIRKWISVKERIAISPPRGHRWRATRRNGFWRAALESAPED